MSRIIRARFTGGLIKPLEKVSWTEGEEISIAILDPHEELTKDAFARSAGKWKGTVDSKTLIRKIYANRRVSTRKNSRL